MESNLLFAAIKGHVRGRKLRNVGNESQGVSSIRSVSLHFDLGWVGYKLFPDLKADLEAWGNNGTQY